MGRLFLLALALAATLCPGQARAKDADILHCPDSRVCSREKINFGLDKVVCLKDGQVISSWLCEYEAGFSCREQTSGEVRSGGLLPAAKGLCGHLCGDCEPGWE
ncbi:MAG: hypothetical protein JW718_05330 [Desulfovibrionaceae bacterium]|nr:hypothetical protein [Desulfovibrionaceae bacterium]